MKNYLKEKFPDIGWEKLTEKLNRIDQEMRGLACYAQIKTLERHNGMLKVVFNDTHELDVAHDIQDAIAYRFERLSARMCEDCGQFGLRRTELKETRTLCTEHYALRYSEEHPVPSMVANPEPHTDY
jgi:hypothetical protein